MLNQRVRRLVMRSTPREETTHTSGRAQISRKLKKQGSLTLCITEITHPKYTYLPTDGGRPPCRKAV